MTREIGAVWKQIAELASRWPESVRNHAPESLADVWPSYVRSDPSPCGIGFEFLDTCFEEPLGPAGYLGRAHDSPFLRSDPRLLRYDVLVSLEDLPLYRIDPFRFEGKSVPEGYAPPQEGLERVFIPTSVLGAYARRADFGAPTIFLGRFGESARSKRSLLDHLRTPLGQHVVVQQFGHVLGLASEHQNPAYAAERALYKLPNDLAAQIRETYGLGGQPSEDELKEHVLEVWPGHPAFSDWGGPTESLAHLDSVMTFASHARLLTVPTAIDRGIQTAPTPTDVRTLIALYGS